MSLMLFFQERGRGGVNLLNVIILLVFSFRLIAGGSHFSKQTGCLFRSEKALILYCSMEYSVQGDKWQRSQNIQHFLKNGVAANIVKNLKDQTRALSNVFLVILIELHVLVIYI